MQLFYITRNHWWKTLCCTHQIRGGDWGLHYIYQNQYIYPLLCADIFPINSWQKKPPSTPQCYYCASDIFPVKTGGLLSLLSTTFMYLKHHASGYPTAQTLAFYHSPLIWNTFGPKEWKLGALCQLLRRHSYTGQMELDLILLATYYW